MSTYRDVEMSIIQWAEARLIIPNSTPVAQTRKTLEEAGELLEAATALKVIKDVCQILGEDDRLTEYRAIWMDKFRDAVGDVGVTIINACALADVDYVDCLNGAYQEIKHRKGTLLPNGIFQKDES
jgi:NTP pyrophosphatase (non-canonical NTP hydrolase)